MTDEVIENMKLDIQEMNSNITTAKEGLCIYYKYRYTFPKDTEKDRQIIVAKDIINLIKKRYTCSPSVTAGIEHYTKGMVSAKPHLHVHFISKMPSNTIRKGLAQEFGFIGRCQGCIPEIIVNEDKFFRYPLKQQKGETKVFAYSTFPVDKSLIMIEVAHTMWIQSAEIAVGKLEKRIERTSEDRLFQYLNMTFETPPTTYHEVLSAACLYYVHNEQTFNYMTVLGYVDKYLIKTGILSMAGYLKLKGTGDFTI